jgi:hypothetical protein
MVRAAVLALRRAFVLSGGTWLLLGHAVATAHAAPVNDFPPYVEGSGAIGERLVCGAGTWSGVPRFGFQWVRDGLAVGSGVAYTVKAADEGHLLWCVVSATLEEFPHPPETTEVPSINSVRVPGVLPTAPVPIEPPVLSGRAAVGEQLSCSSGSWHGTPPITFAYEWVRDPGSEETRIEGASSATHAVTVDDQGHALACRVTATNSAGRASSRSNAESVAGTPPQANAPPRVLGLAPASVGETLACSPGEWGGRPRPSLKYAWLRDGEQIATASAYKVTASDELHMLTCKVTAANNAGTVEAPSSNGIRVLGSRPLNTQIPAVSGAPSVGSVLSCDGGAWSGVPGPPELKLTYLWVRDLGMSGQESLGTAAEYTVAAEDAGKTLSCVVTAKNPEGEAASSSEPVVVPSGAGASLPENTLAPTVVGEGTIGRILKCEPGTWTGEPFLGYEWLRDGARIARRAEQTYRVEEVDATHAISCRVSAINEAGNAHQDSSNTVRVAGTAPKELEGPSLSGTGEVNEVLTCRPGRWTGAPAPSATFQWLRNGSPIAGAAGPEYKIGSEDRGYLLSCRVTESNGVGSAPEATSAGVPIPGNQPRPTQPPQIIGRPEPEGVLTCLPGSWSGWPQPTFTYQWLLEGSPIPQATGEKYEVVGGEQGLSLSCAVTATNGVGSDTASSNPLLVPGTKPSILEPPRVSGAASVGALLKCEAGRWEGKPPPVLTYQWLRDGVRLQSANASTYTVELADEGHALSCLVTAANGEGSLSAGSNSFWISTPPTPSESKAEAPAGSGSGAQGPTRAEILGSLGAQLARAQHHARIATLRQRHSYSIAITLPAAGKLELMWYLAPVRGHRASNPKPLVVAVGSATYEGAATKTVRLRLTTAGRTLIERSFSLQLTLRAVFLRPQKPSLLWTKTVGLDF